MDTRRPSEQKGMPIEYQRLLYEDEEGNLVGLDEVQLLDDPPTWRIPRLRQLLQDDDLFLQFQASLVLTAWGDPAGLRAVEHLIDSQVHLKTELSPHRLGGYDNVYDELADAVRKYSLCVGETQDTERIYRKLLSLYGSLQFESKLKHALLRSNLGASLLEPVCDAIQRAEKLGRHYLASQLLPIAARWSSDRVSSMISRFLQGPREVPDPLCNVAEALGYIDEPWSHELLHRLRGNEDPAVTSEAQVSLAKLASKGRG